MPVLWRVVAGQLGERHRAGARYWWDNAERAASRTWLVQWTRKGSIQLDFSGQWWEVGAGDVMVLRYGERSRYGRRDRLSQAYVCDWVAVEGAGLGEHLARVRARSGPVVPAVEEATFREMFGEVVRGSEPAGRRSGVSHALAVSRLLHRLVELADQESEAVLTPVQRLADRLAAEPLRAWSLKQVAAREGVSREHLCRVFHDRHGLPPHAFFIRARRTRALWLLRQTDLSLSRIAELAGFERVYTLARHVRDEAGVSPTAYRAAHQHTQRPGEVNSKSRSTAASSRPSQAAAARR